MYHGDSRPQDLATDAAMTALYRQLDNQDLPDDPGFAIEVGLRDLTSRIARRELVRPDALVTDAELPEPDVNGLSSGIGVINVNGGNVTIAPGYLGEAADAEDRVNAALAGMERQMQRLAALQETLNDTSAQPQSRPRRIWEALLWPALGGGILAAVLGAAAVIAAIHASAAAMSVIGIILAAAAALTALLSLSVPWTSVRALNRQGDAYRALELLSGRNPVTTAYTGAAAAGWNRDMLAGQAAPLPEIKDDIIAARLRIEKAWLRRWEEDQMRRMTDRRSRPQLLAQVRRDRTASTRPSSRSEFPSQVDELEDPARSPKAER